MKTLIFGLAALILATGAASADAQGRALFVPVVEEVDQPTNPVHRDKRNHPNFATVQLSDADPKHVDQNRDGQVSFKELLTFDF